MALMDNNTIVPTLSALSDERRKPPSQIWQQGK
jgi:hypothetical protein